MSAHSWRDDQESAEGVVLGRRTPAAISDDDLRQTILTMIGEGRVHVRVEDACGLLDMPRRALHATLGQTDGVLTIIIASRRPGRPSSTKGDPS